MVVTPNFKANIQFTFYIYIHKARRVTSEATEINWTVTRWAEFSKYFSWVANSRPLVLLQFKNGIIGQRCYSQFIII